VSYLDERADLAGKVAVLVGGGGGIGRACAVDLAGAGMRLAVCDKDEEALKDCAAAVSAAGADVMTSQLDARDPEALSEFFTEVDAGYGSRHDVLVNVVGGTFRQPFAESSPRGWDALIRTNFTWLLHSTQLAVTRMRPAGGSIINITSIEAHRAAPGFAENIRVNTIAPDYIATPALSALNEGVTKEASALQHRISTPMGRVGTYEDAGGCALFLASNLSAFVTGSTLHPDGGAIASAGWFNWPDEGYLNHPPPRILNYLLEE
jgi:3-oxoacyl-[acyl-carrier protein] reductase